MGYYDPSGHAQTSNCPLGANRVSGNHNVANEGRVQSHPVIQDKWAQKMFRVITETMQLEYYWKLEQGNRIRLLQTRNVREDLR